MPRSLVLAACLLAGCGHLGGGDAPAVSVEVVDSETDEPLRGAQVAIGTDPAREVDGAARAEWGALPSGTYAVRAEAPGWLPADTTVVVGDDPARVRLVLRPEPGRAVSGLEALDLLADPVNTAVLQRRGFYQRRRTSTGTFVSRSEIAQRGMREFSDVMRTVPGIRIDRSDGGTRALSARRRACVLDLFLDGVEARSMAAQLESIEIDDVAGVEVYRGVSEAPAEFHRNRPTGDCGVILVWTAIAR